ncbi:MAG: hypothetical protein R3A43_02055 [Bacteroidia bacterium]
MDVRLFLKYDIDRIIALAQHHKPHPTVVWRRSILSLFQEVLRFIQKGMVKGKRQAVDSAFIKANASMIV